MLDKKRRVKCLRSFEGSQSHPRNEIIECKYLARQAHTPVSAAVAALSSGLRVFVMRRMEIYGRTRA
jgi:hypothetical protein